MHASGNMNEDGDEVLLLQTNLESVDKFEIGQGCWVRPDFGRDAKIWV